MTNALTNAQREAVGKAIQIANSVQHFRTAKHLREILAMQHPDHSGNARFFVYSNDVGYNEYKAAAERADAHKAEIANYLDTMGDGRSEEVTTVVSGIVSHITRKTCSIPNPEHADDASAQSARNTVTRVARTSIARFATMSPWRSPPLLPYRKKVGMSGRSRSQSALRLTNESHRTTFHVIVDRSDRPTVDVLDETGRMNVFQSEIREHAEIEAKPWDAFLCRSHPTRHIDFIAAALTTPAAKIAEPMAWMYKCWNTVHLETQRLDHYYRHCQVAGAPDAAPICRGYGVWPVAVPLEGRQSTLYR